VAIQLGVREASVAYESAMRNVAPAGIGVCPTCHTFFDYVHHSECHGCGHHPSNARVVVPISYSEHLGQLHLALRAYKRDGSTTSRHHAVRLAGVLWRFLAAHEACVATAAGASGFELVTTVPSSYVERDEQPSNLRRMVEICKPVNGRYARALRPSGRVDPKDRAYDPQRYDATMAIPDAVLLIDDTWASGSHAEAAAAALKKGGAKTVAVVTIGLHVRRDWTAGGGRTIGQRLDDIPTPFDWETCAVHGPD
jgi:predicted amidophosphoribosyltransferase